MWQHSEQQQYPLAGLADQVQAAECASAEPVRIGETLPLFANGDVLSEAPRQAVRRRTQALQQGQAMQQGQAIQKVQALRQIEDRHMRAAWQLSKALKAAKSGHKSGRKIAQLTPGQRRQVGNAICEHLLASLRQQVDAEKSMQ